jgi:hypothetical protein
MRRQYAGGGQVDGQAEPPSHWSSSLDVECKRWHAHAFLTFPSVAEEEQSDDCQVPVDLEDTRVDFGEEGCRERIEGDLIESEVWKGAWVGQDNGRQERRADGRLCHCLQAHCGVCETVRCPLAYSWSCSRTAASGSQNRIHVPCR